MKLEKWWAVKDSDLSSPNFFNPHTVYPEGTRLQYVRIEPDSGVCFRSNKYVFELAPRVDARFLLAKDLVITPIQDSHVFSISN
jgi:hypothetical protein